MSEKSTAGKPWETVKTFSQFAKADGARNSIKEHSPTWEVKVRRTAAGNFNVNVRKPPTNPKPTKKNKKTARKKIK